MHTIRGGKCHRPLATKHHSRFPLASPVTNGEETTRLCMDSAGACGASAWHLWASRYHVCTINVLQGMCHTYGRSSIDGTPMQTLHLQVPLSGTVWPGNAQLALRCRLLLECPRSFPRKEYWGPLTAFGFAQYHHFGGAGFVNCSPNDWGGVIE